MLAVSHTLDTLFTKLTPPVYTTSTVSVELAKCQSSLCDGMRAMCLWQEFAATFMREIKRYRGPGAGIPIELNSRGDAVVRFEVRCLW